MKNEPARLVSVAEADVAFQEYRQEGKISHELVEKVADIVFAMLLDELRIERERMRTVIQMCGRGCGGW